ncbi:MAG: hypothetical protein AMXMBFR7_04190 [Planctomycetota bacterium]
MGKHRMGVTLNWARAGCWLAAGMLALCTGVNAQDVDPTEAIPSSIKEEQFKFDIKGRRDPFTFAKVDTVVKPVPTPGETPGVADANELNKIREAAKRSFDQAEQALMSANSRNAMALADQGLEAINKAKVPLTEWPELQELQEKLFRLRLAAERLFNREEAEVAFKNLNITVTGVVAKDRSSRAIVNSHVVGRGDLVETGDESSVVIVDQILPGKVIVRFRGFRMKLDVAQ